MKKATLKMIKESIREAIQKDRRKAIKYLWFNVEKGYFTKEELKEYNMKDYLCITYDLDSIYNISGLDNFFCKIMKNFGYEQSGSGCGGGGRDLSFFLSC